jgi:hypothetical protein
MRCFIALLMPLVLTAQAWAQGSERDRLTVERQGLVDRFAAEERACRERFVVTACVDDMRVRRRAALEPLRERELALDDAERQQRAKDRQAARAARPQAAPAAASNSAAASAAAAPVRLSPAVAAPLHQAEMPHEKDGQSSRALQAAERARAAAKRADLLDATQAELARKSAERAATGKAVSPLPTPEAASAAR